MNKTVLLALFAGLLGGLLTRYVAPVPVFAQTAAAQPAREIRAQSFALVDPSDRVAAAFTVEPVPSGLAGRGANVPKRIVLRNAAGQEIWSAGAPDVRPLALK